MTAKSRLLIIGHAPSDNSQTLISCLQRGATDPQVSDVTVNTYSPFDVNAEHLLAADALILFSTENFGYMNGALKDLFERIYYPCLNDPVRNEATPYALVVKAGNDGTGAVNSIQRIVTGLQWKEAMPALICKGEHQPHFEQQCIDYGLTMAASLDARIL